MFELAHLEGPPYSVTPTGHSRPMDRSHRRVRGIASDDSVLLIGHASDGPAAVSNQIRWCIYL